MGNSTISGIIHSFQSMGAVDGPGLRYVIFMQGCPLRCVYCHNPDTWGLGGKEYSVNDIIEKVLKYKPYFGEKGGVTVSGGEPLLQWKFIAELFSHLQGEGIHTALDTSGIGSFKNGSVKDVEALLKHTNLIICDLKFSDEAEYIKNCKGKLVEVLSFLKLTEELNIPLWIRHVVVPGLTDSKENIRKITRIAEQFLNLQKLELLPFKKLCIPKYQELEIIFPLRNYSECPDSLINELYEVIDTVDSKLWKHKVDYLNV